MNSKEDKIIRVVEAITNKKPVFSSSKIFSQTKTEIYYRHILELFHELAHYIVSSYQNHPNLGFNGRNHESSEILMRDERLAMYLTYKLIKSSHSDSKSLDYGDYFKRFSLTEVTMGKINISFAYSENELDLIISEKIKSQNLSWIFDELEAIKEEYQEILV